ncbi:MAG: hypothetical protein EBZ77_10980 [Chitinophagia bacterium]|nr:hypothetical protein [Chitinophagia bacterium]
MIPVTAKQKPAPYAEALAVLLGAICLLLPALLNGYPLINTDLGTYLPSGFTLEEPIDRPIAYGLLLRVATLSGKTLYGVVVLQSVLMSWLIVRLIRRMAGGHQYPWLALGIIAFLSVFSSVSWIVSEALPDVFTSIALLALLLLLLQQEQVWVNLLLFFMYTFSITTHISHLAIFCSLMGMVLVLFRWLFGSQHRGRGAIVAAAALLLTLFSVFSMKHALSGSRHVFGMASILEKGILKPYLDETCPTEHYKICAFKDNLNTNPNFFLWYPESPVNLTGGWAANKEEYSKIINDTYRRPRFLAMHVKTSLKFTAMQAIQFGIGDGNYKVGLGDVFGQYVPSDMEAYQHALQRKEQLLPYLGWPNAWIYITVVLSLLVILLLGSRYLRNDTDYRLLVFVVLAGIAMNMWACATFGQINGRYGCRVMWLVPLVAAVGIARYSVSANSRKTVA